LLGLDAARALAFLGMLWVNFGVALGAEGPVSSDPRTWMGLLQGRAAATFVVLAGIGLSLGARRARASKDDAERRAARAAIFKRSLALFVVGTLSLPAWPADILHYYGVYLALAALVLFWPGVLVAAICVASALLYPLALLVFDYEAGWDWETLEYSGLWSIDGFARNLLLNGFHPVWPWWTFIAVGLLIGRLDLSSLCIQRRLLTFGAAAWIAGESLSRLGHALWVPQLDGEAAELVHIACDTAPMPPMPLYLLVGSGVACTVVGACLLAERVRILEKLVQALAPAGALALTHYVAHVFIGLGTLEALGWLSEQGSTRLAQERAMASAALFGLVSLVGAALWLRFSDRGPLEALLRRVSRPRPPQPSQRPHHG
jgi:uncharacterized membrane protein YeiB